MLGLLLLSYTLHSGATVPLCQPGVVDHFIASDVVAVARAIDAARTRPVDADHALVGVYRILSLLHTGQNLRRNLNPGETIIVVAFCSDSENNSRDCLAAQAVSLPGIDATSGTIRVYATGEPVSVVLYIEEDYRPGAPGLTYQSVRNRGRYPGYYCGHQLQELEAWQLDTLRRHGEVP